MGHAVYDPADDFGDRLTRLEDGRVETASQIAANTVMVSALSDQLVAGFARLDQALTAGMSQIGRDVHQLREAVQQHGAQLQSDREARQRWRTAGKWAAGVAGAVAGAIVLHGLGLR